jgi:hypothetical protein
MLALDAEDGGTSGRAWSAGSLRRAAENWAEVRTPRPGGVAAWR